MMDPYMQKTEALLHSVGECSRCETVVEPLLSEQWFVRIKPLADEAIAGPRQQRARTRPGA